MSTTNTTPSFLLPAMHTGSAIIPVGTGQDYARSVIQQADGKLVLAGYSQVGSDYDYSIVRLNADGSLDTSFGSGGKSIIPVGTSTDYAYSVIQQADGKLVLAGYSSGSSNSDYSIIRLNADSSLDSSFGNGGKSIIPVGTSTDYAYSVIQQADGKLVLAGYSSGSSNSDYSIIRLNADSSLDSSFGNGGKSIIPVGTSGDFAYSVIQQADGKLVLAGYSSGSSNSDYSIIRLNADSSLDSSFGNGGKSIIPVGTGSDFAYSVIQQADGKLVLAGYSSNGTNNDYSIIRLNADGSLDTSFGTVTSGNANTLNAAPTYTENAAPLVLDSSVIITDADLAALDGGAGNYAGASVTLARAGGASAQDVFSASGSLTFSGSDAILSGTTVGSVSNSGGTLTITFNSAATQAAVNAVLSAIAYSNTSDAPPASVQIDWSFSDGNTGSQGTGGAGTTSGSTTVNITAVNDAPVIIDVPASAQSVTAGTAADLADFTVADADGADVNLTVTLTTTNGTLGGLIDADSNTAGIQLTGTAAQINAAIASATFTASAAGAASIDISVSDGVNSPTTASYGLSAAVLLVNSAPSFVLPAVHTGKTIIPVGSSTDVTRSAIQQTDGKLVLAGYSSNGTNNDYSIVRLNADGSLDTSFGSGGKELIPVGSSTDQAYSVIQQADGKLVLIGESVRSGNDIDFGIIRLNADGTLDTGFDTDGKALIAVGSSTDTGRSVIQQADGKLVLAGYSQVGSDYDYSIVRLNADGSLDTSFGSGGKELIPVGSSTDQAYSVIQQADGKLVLAGYSSNGTNNDYSIVRLNADGSLDTSFGSGGKELIPVGSSTDQAYSVIQQADGKLILAGFSTNGGTSTAYYDFSIIRLNADGSLDTSFGTDGKSIIPVGNGLDYGSSVIQQADGKLVLAGYSSNGGNLDYSIVRLNTDGSLDTSFGSGGKSIIPVSSSGDYVYSVIQQADGKLALAGYSLGSSTPDYSIIRLNADGSLDTSFGTVTSGNANTLNAAPSYTENAAPLVLDSSVIITDTDLAALDGGAGNYAGASVTLARAGGASAQDVFSASGSLTFSGSDAILSGTTVGSVSNSGGTLTITFNSAATQAAVNAVLSAIAYSNTSDAPPASVQIDWSFSDGNTGSQGTGGAGTTSGTTIVNITAVNDVPTGTVTLSGTPAQGETLNADTSTLADADGLGTLSYQWLADGVAISGATATTYTLTLSEAGKSITVHVSYTDAEGTQESVVSAAVDVSHVFTGTPDPDSITGTGLNDTIYGLDRDDSLSAGAGDDLLDGGDGNDTLDGGAGLDTASYANASSAVNVLLYSTAAPQTTGGAGSDTLLNIENLTGSAYNDSLKGSTANNVLIGGLGNDSLDGWSGSDTMEGGDGNDTYYVNIAGDVVIETNADSVTGGVDTVYTMLSNYTLGANVENGVLYTSSAVNLTGNSLNNVLTSNAGNNVMDGSAGIDTVSYATATSSVTATLASTASQNTGGSGLDTLINIENLTGSAYNDSLTGSSADNVLTGGSGDDVLDGLTGNDTLDGGAGLDTASYANASAAVNVLLYSTAAPQTTGGAGSDTLLNIENLTGSAYNDSLKGSTANNVLIGGLGNDSLDGWSGSDTMEGGDGNDTYYVNIAGDVVIETNADSVTGGVDTVYTMLSDYTLGANVENGVLYTSSAVNLTGNSLNNVLTSNAGNNVMDGSAGIDTVSYATATSSVTATLASTASQNTGGSGLDTLINIENLTGSAYNDSLTGSSADNVLTGGSGDDVLDGLTGNDTLDGGAGLDTASYANASAAVNVLLYSTAAPQTTGGAGSDTLLNIENLTGSAYNDSLKGSNANNVLIGGLGNDSLDGWSGSDTMEGGSGNDTYYVNIAGDVVIETNADSVTGGVDTVYTMLSDYTLGANVENGVLYTSSAVNLTGNSLNNVLRGNANDNVMDGGTGDDTLDGGDGNDTMNGGAGQDTLTGGSGNDIFSFNMLSDLGLGSTARDVISDFTVGQDRIDLHTMDANISLGGDQAFSWVSSFTATAGQVRYADGIVYLNTDDDADAEYEIELTGSVPASLSAADFIL